MDNVHAFTLSAADALALRYGAEHAPAHGPWNEQSRCCCRTARSVVTSPTRCRPARWKLWWRRRNRPRPAPTCRPSVVAVTDAGKKATLAQLANNQKHIEQCPLFLVWVADISRNQRLAAEEGVTLETLPYQETFLVAAIDAALAAQNATVAAELLGLSTVYIGALRNNPREVAKVVGLPPGAFAVFGMCVGYASEAAASEVKPRLPQAVVLHREVYNSSQERPLREAYDHLMAAFSTRNEITLKAMGFELT